MTKEQKIRLERAKRYGDVTENGVAFEWYLSGPDGASFVLLREAGHTDEDITKAKSILRKDRDVVNISIEQFYNYYHDKKKTTI